MTAARAARRAAAALAIIGVFAPVVASAQARTAYVSWSSSPVAVRATIGAETDIAFAPGEQITYAEVDDAVRWTAREAAPIADGDAQIQRVAVTPSEASSTALLVRTTERTYRIKLVGVPSAPTHVAFVYSHTFISRSATIATPPPAAAVVESPAIAPPIGGGNGARFSAPRQIAAASFVPAIGPAGEVFPAFKPPPPCAGGTDKGGGAVRAMQYASQATNAVVVSRAVNSHTVARAIFGFHSLPFYLGTFVLEDIFAAHAAKNACPTTRNLINLGMTAAALLNAANTPSVPR